MDGNVTLQFWHGGNFKRHKEGLVYLGGSGRAFSVDPDELCWFYLEELAIKCGGGKYGKINGIYYLLPGCSLEEGLRLLYRDAEVLEMAGIAIKKKCIDLYVLHGVNEDDQRLLELTNASVNTSCKQNDTPHFSALPVKKLTPRRGPQKESFAACGPVRTSPRRKCLNNMPENAQLEVVQPTSTKKTHLTHSTPEKRRKNPSVETLTHVNHVAKSLNHPSSSNSITPNFNQEILTQKSSAQQIPHISQHDVASFESDWEDPRPESPLKWGELLGDYWNNDIGDVNGPNYQPEYDASYDEEGDKLEDDGLCELGEENESSESSGDDLLDEEDILAEELEGTEAETSDDEYRIAVERVKGTCSKLIALTQQLQKEAEEGKLGENKSTTSLLTPTKNKVAENEEWVSEYEDSEEDIHTPVDSEEEAETGSTRGVRGSIISDNTDFSVFHWKVGQRFPSRKDFKTAVTKFAILQGRNLSVTGANMKRQQRMEVRCADGCPFRLYSAWDSRRATFTVRSVDSEHTCVRNMEKNKQLKASWLAKQFLDVFKARPHWPAKELIETVRRAYRVLVKKPYAYKVKYHAHRMLHGSMQDHYNKVGRYLAALKAASPDTHLVLVSDETKNPPVFQRLFVCFDGVRKGWLEGCRKIICIDACFLKTFLGGQLMAAVGRDSNDQMFPIAWAVVEGENNNSWEWFLTELQKCLCLGDGTDIVVISDEHQSILSGVAHVLPQAEHRHCARHIFAHWHKSYKGDEMKLVFWRAAKAYNLADYDDALEDMGKTEPDAVEAFKSYNPQVFCRAFMKTTTKVDVICNNLAETFNGYIINARVKHLISMLEDIRTSLMKRLAEKREEMQKGNWVICPRIQARLEKEKVEAAQCDPIPSTSQIFQVNYYMDSLTVNLENRTCTCRKWDMTGIPCRHAISCIYLLHRNAEDFVDDCYRNENYMKAYSTYIPPCVGERHWPKVDLPLNPPPIKIGPGRPRLNRMKDPHEDPKRSGRLTRHGMEMTCSICQKKGHNKRRCPNRDIVPLTTTQPVVVAPKRGPGRPRKDGNPPRSREETPQGGDGPIKRQRTSSASSSSTCLQTSHHSATAEPTRIGRGGRIIRGRGSRCEGSTRERGISLGATSHSSSGRGKGRGQGKGKGGRSSGSKVPQGVGVFIPLSHN